MWNMIVVTPAHLNGMEYEIVVNLLLCVLTCVVGISTAQSNQLDN